MLPEFTRRRRLFDGTALGKCLASPHGVLAPQNIRRTSAKCSQAGIDELLVASLEGAIISRARPQYIHSTAGGTGVWLQLHTF
jgi:hypothetical protein